MCKCERATPPDASRAWERLRSRTTLWVVRRKRRSADTLDEAGPGPLARLLHEALDRVANPDARDSVLYMALADGGLTVVPEDPSTFRRFALGPLRRAMHLTLGDEFADAVLSDLTPIIERAASTITSNPPAGAVDLSAYSLVIATQRMEWATACIDASPDGASTRVVAEVFDLVTAVEAYRQTRLAVVIDAALPSVSTAALSTLCRVLPSTARVLLVGEPEGDFPEEWRVLAEDVEAAQVVEEAFPKTASGEDAPRVLVIEAHATTRAAVVADLSSAEMEVRSAPDAMMGAELVASWKPSAVVLSSALRGVDAGRFCALVRRMTAPDVPALIVLVASQTELVPGADELLVRGVDDHRIAEAVRALQAKAPS